MKDGIEGVKSWDKWTVVQPINYHLCGTRSHAHPCSFYKVVAIIHSRFTIHLDIKCAVYAQLLYLTSDEVNRVVFLGGFLSDRSRPSPSTLRTLNLLLFSLISVTDILYHNCIGLRNMPWTCGSSCPGVFKTRGWYTRWFAASKENIRTIWA